MLQRSVRQLVQSSQRLDLKLAKKAVPDALLATYHATAYKRNGRHHSNSTPSRKNTAEHHLTPEQTRDFKVVMRGSLMEGGNKLL
jgi:hypothetical protein